MLTAIAVRMRVQNVAKLQHTRDKKAAFTKCAHFCT